MTAIGPRDYSLQNSLIRTESLSLTLLGIWQTLADYAYALRNVCSLDVTSLAAFVEFLLIGNDYALYARW
jgi:hypothetical protein